MATSLFCLTRPIFLGMALLMVCSDAVLDASSAPGASNPAAPLAPAAYATVPLADGFDFPVGKPDAVGYHKARGFTPNGHLGEDWDGDGGGNTDLGDPIYAIGSGVVVLARDMRVGWGNVVILRHSFREPAAGNAVVTFDSLYGHLDAILVGEGQVVARGQQIGTMGTAHGLYDSHLHLELHKNIAIGMYRSAFARDFSNYYDPTEFVKSHRRINGGGPVAIALHTFVPYPGGSGLPPSDGAFELGINHSPSQAAAMKASHLNKSAFSIRAHGTFDKIDDAYRYDRFSDLREKDNP
jgi:murein DD-endopeptidase MepM/ murein hydrolase activator NlpD